MNREDQPLEGAPNNKKRRKVWKHVVLDENWGEQMTEEGAETLSIRELGYQGADMAPNPDQTVPGICSEGGPGGNRLYC